MMDAATLTAWAAVIAALTGLVGAVGAVWATLQSQRNHVAISNVENKVVSLDGKATSIEGKVDGHTTALTKMAAAAVDPAIAAIAAAKVLETAKSVQAEPMVVKIKPADEPLPVSVVKP